MRFLHTSDWHLGRIFHGKSLLEDQHGVLRRILHLAVEAEVDAILVAGDVYDRAIPPVEAVHLLDWFLCEACLTHEIPVVMIAGNHDSSERLGFGSRLVDGKGLHLAGSLEAAARPLVLHDEHGAIRIHGLPYADPPLLRDVLQDDSITSHEKAMRKAVRWIRSAAGNDDGSRAILVAHAFVAGAEPTDSERPLSIAGAGTVSADAFAGFHYTALGHLHRPQNVTNRVRYSGSLLRYSFSELGHGKSVSLVDLRAAHELPTVTELALEPERQLRRVRGYLADLVRGAAQDPRPNDYLLVTLEDDGPVLDPLGKLRPYYPNVLHVERLGLSSSGRSPTAARRETTSEKQLFSAFFEEVTGDPLSEEQRQALTQVLERFDAPERTSPEASA